MEDLVTRLNSNNYSSFIQKNYGKPILLLLTDMKKVGLLYHFLSHKFNKVLFAVMYNTDLTAKKFNLPSPSIVLLNDPLNHKGLVFEGKINKREVMKFISDNVYRKKFKMQSEGISELTKERLEIGTCGKKDKNFCVIALVEDGN